METKQLTTEQVALLKKPLPAAAISQHPTKKFLSSIKAIYVVERLNDVFGIGKWTFKSTIVDSSDKMVLVQAFFAVPEYGIELESFGGNDNVDKGDALKGASTDALTKIGSYLGIGMDVFKGLGSTPAPAAPQPTEKETMLENALQTERTKVMMSEATNLEQLKTIFTALTPVQKKALEGFKNGVKAKLSTHKQTA